MVIITLGGMPGSGKSTLGKLLAARLDMPFFSMGDVRRQYAIANNMTLAELNKRGEQDPASDALVDEYQKKLPFKHNSFVIDSRLGYHFLPKSIKLFVKVDLRVAATRIYSQKRESEKWSSVEDGERELRERIACDIKRYKQYYALDPSDLTQYDLVLDSTSTDPETLLHRVILFLRLKGVVIPPEPARKRG